MLGGPSERQESLALLQKGAILFQRKVYDGAIRALTDCRRHLHDRSPELVELRIASGLLGCRYGITDLVAKKIRPATRPDFLPERNQKLRR